MKSLNSPKFVDHFLGIAICEYTDKMGKLRNPVNDIYAVRQVLIDFYDLKEGNTTVLDDENATKSNIIKTIESYNWLTEKDRLLIYFSGHGNHDKEIDVAYWIPKDGLKDDKVTWISEGDFVNALKYLKKCKHVLVISDSCFGAHFLFPPSKNFSGYAAEMLDKSSRYGLASGESYVSDGPTNQNSPFTKALVETLSANKTLLPLDELHIGMRKHLSNIQSIHQNPHIGRIRGLSEDSFGQFVFIPSDHANITSKVAFEEAEEIDTLDAWDGFIRQHPTSPMYSKSIAHFNQLALVFLKQALNEEAIDLLEDFQKDYPLTPLNNKAKEYIQRIRFTQERKRALIAYELAREEDTVKGYSYFLKHFSHPEFTGKAKKRRRALEATEELEELLASTSVARLEIYLSREIDLKVQEQIKSRIIDLQFQESLDSLSIEKIDNFIANFKAQLSAEQETILVRRKKELSEEKVFNQIKKRNNKNLDGFIQYFESYGKEGKLFERAKTDFFPFLETVLIDEITKDVKSSEYRGYSPWSSIDRLNKLEFWKDYQRQLNIKDEIFQNFYKNRYDLGAKFDYYAAHFPNSKNRLSLKRTVKEKLLEESFEKARVENSLKGYQDFWRSESLIVGDNSMEKLIQKPFSRWGMFFVFLLLLSVSIFYVYPKWQIDKAARLYFEEEHEEAYTLLAPYEGSNDPKVLHFLNASRFAVLDSLVDPCEDLFKAGEQNFFRSQYVLACMYLEGYAPCNIPMDIVEGLGYLQLAADQKEERALFRLAGLYQQGLEIYLPKDGKKALELYVESALLGHQEAQIFLGDSYWSGNGVSVDKEKALRWYRMAALKGEDWSQIFVGHYWSEADETSNNFNKAIYWYRLAVQKGNPMALYAIGELYLQYEMTDSAMLYYHKAAEEGSSDAQYELAERYLKGSDLSKDSTKGIYWMEQCSKNGDKRATMFLGKLYYEENSTVVKDITKAKKYFHKAAQEEVAQSNFYLGQIHLLKPNNIDSALYYFREAHKKDIREATEYLANYSFSNKKYTDSANLYNQLIDKGYSLDSIGINNLVSLLVRNDKIINQQDAVTYLGQAVDSGNEKAAKYFFQHKYQELIDRRHLIPSSKRRRIIRLSTEQISYLENYADVNDNEFLFLCGFFLEKDLEPKGTSLSFDILITDSLSLSYLERATKLGNPFAAYKLGQYYFKEKEYTLAKNYYLQAVEKRNELPDVLRIEAFLTLGEISINQTFDINSTFSEPIKYFKEVLKYTKKDARPYISLCRIYHQNEKSVQAKMYCTIAMEIGDEEAKKICIEENWFIPPEELGFWDKVKQGIMK